MFKVWKNGGIDCLFRTNHNSRKWMCQLWSVNFRLSNLSSQDEAHNLRRYPAAVFLYWITNNLLSAAQVLLQRPDFIWHNVLIDYFEGKNNSPTTTKL